MSKFYNKYTGKWVEEFISEKKLKTKLYQKKYYQDNKKVIDQRRKLWNIKNPDRNKEYDRKEYDRAYYIRKKAKAELING